MFSIHVLQIAMDCGGALFKPAETNNGVRHLRVRHVVVGTGVSGTAAIGGNKTKKYTEGKKQKLF